MKKNNKKNLILSLVAATLLVGCDDNTFVQNGSNPVGDANGNAALLDLQSFYETLKTASGGTTALDKLLERISEIEYGDLTTAGFSFNEETDGIIKSYRTRDAFLAEITEHFQDIVDGTSYVDDNGAFEESQYVEYIEGLDGDYELEKLGTSHSKYISIPELTYNYDEYIENEIIPDIYQDYLYQDYILGSNKYKGQFANQYGITFEVLRIDNYTTALNSAWTEALIRDVRAVTTQENAQSGFAFNSNNYDLYSFVTSNTYGQLIEFRAGSNALTYRVYEDAANSTAIADLLDKLFDRDPSVQRLLAGDANVMAAEAASTLVADQSWEINTSTKPDSEFFSHIEDLLIARRLYNIDQEVIMARNYDFKNDEYEAYTETEKTQAQSYSSTYSSSNSQSVRKGEQSSKRTAQQTVYFTESDTYTKANYGNVLPSAISSLRGTTARELVTNLVQFNDENYLLPNKEGLSSPVYLDSDYYYIVKVSDWYGYYAGNPHDREAPYKSIASYQIDAYQSGTYSTWELSENGKSYEEVTTDSAGNPLRTKDNQSIIDLVQTSAENILTASMRTEAIVSMFEKYSLEINDEEVYAYISGQYPDYFD